MLDEITATPQRLNELVSPAVFHDPVATEEGFRSGFEYAGVGLAHVALDGSFLCVNPHFCAVSGYSAEELHGLRVQDITHPDDIETDRENARALIAGEIPRYSIEKRYLRADGTAVPIALTVTLVRRPGGDPDYLVGVVTDAVKARQNTVLPAKAAAETFSFFALVDLAGTVVQVDGSLRALGDEGSVRDACGEPFEALSFWAHDPQLRRRLRQTIAAAAAGVPGRLEVFLRLHDGRRHTLDLSIAPLRNTAGRIEFIAVSATDVTARKRVEETTRESQARLRLALDAGHMSMWSIRHGDRHMQVDGRLVRWLGLAPEVREATLSEFFAACHPDDRDLVARSVRQSWQDGCFEADFRLMVRKDEVRWFSGKGHVACGPDGGLVLFGILFDITRRKSQERDLSRTAGQLQLALDAGRLGWCHFDIDARRFTASEPFKTSHGYCVDEICSLPDLVTRLHPGDRAKVKAALARILRDGSDYDVVHRVIQPSGDVRWLAMRGRLIADDGRRRAFFVTADITERQRAEQAKAAGRQRELVVCELGHRLNNLFPVVLSVAGIMAAQHDDVADYHQALDARLRSIWATHGLLTRGASESAMVEELVRIETNPFAAVQISLSGPEIYLSGGVAEGFAMIIHELATNAVKHGALSVPEGRVDVEWSSTGRRMTLNWVERGGPTVARPVRTGFGSSVIGASAQPPVCGCAEVDFRPDGLCYRLTLSLDG